MKEILIISLVGSSLLNIYFLLKINQQQKKQKLIKSKLKKKLKEFEWINNYCLLNLNNDSALAQLIQKKVTCFYKEIHQLSQELESDNFHFSQSKEERRKYEK